MSVLYFLSEGTHRFIIGIFPLFLAWVILDSLRVFPSYLYNNVHIKDLYLAELNLFGINYHNETLTPNNFLKLFDSTFLNFGAGLTYLMWIPIPVILCLFFYFRKPNILLQFTSCFLFTNLMGIVLYYLYPAAPPWYIDLYGFELQQNVPGYAARLQNFDEILNLPVFEGIYSKSFNVFGAVPSLHSAYPLLSFYYARKAKFKWWACFLILYMLATWFTAVYSNHHYVIDVLLGIACAAFSLLIFEQIFLRKIYKIRANKK